jgi:hypothetical protein
MPQRVASFFDQETRPKQAPRTVSTRLSAGELTTLGSPLNLEGMKHKEVSEKLKEVIAKMQKDFAETHRIAIKLGGETAKILNDLEDAKETIKEHIKNYTPKTDDSSGIVAAWEAAKHHERHELAKKAPMKEHGLRSIHSHITGLSKVPKFNEELEPFPDANDGMYIAKDLLHHCFRLKAYTMLRKKAEILEARNDGGSSNDEAYHEFITYEDEGEVRQAHLKQLKEKLKELKEEARERQAAAQSGEGGARKKKRKGSRRSKKVHHGPATRPESP